MTRWAEIAKEKLSEYETADEDGKLLVLPCKVGDTVWVITHPFNVFDDFDFYEDAHDEIYESYVSSITLYENSNQYRIYAKKQDNLSRHILESVILENQSFLTEKKQRAH